MSIRSGEETSESFAHVANAVLRQVLRSDPQHVLLASLQQALGWTLDALGRDVISDEIPETTLAERIEAAREADKALAQGQRVHGHRAPCRFWKL